MNYRKQEVTGILLCVLALCIFFSFLTYNPLETPMGLSPEIAQTNIMGLFGIYTSYYLMKFSFGWGTFFLPIIMGLIGFNLFSRRNLEQTWRYSIFLTGLGIWAALLFAWIGQYKGGMWQAEYPGLIGFVLWKFFIDIFGIFASALIHIVAFILLLSGLFHFSIYSTITSFIKNMTVKWAHWQKQKKLGKLIVKKEEDTSSITTSIPVEDDNRKLNSNDTIPKEDVECSDIADSGDKQFVSDANDDIKLENPSDQGGIYENIAIEDETEIEEGDLDADKERQTKYPPI